MLKFYFRRIKVGPRKTDKRTRKKNLLKHKEDSRKLVHSRLEHFNQFYNFKYNAVRIRAQTTRWGSCSTKGNLNFNYKIVLLPPHLADYLIVHELCHIKEFNHGKNFWDEVSKTIPDYIKLRDELRNSHLNYL